MSSRNIDDLSYPIRKTCKDFVALGKEQGLDIMVYCTARDITEQAMLYRQGRSLAKIKSKAKQLSDVYGRSDLAKLLLDVGPQQGRRVTNAGPGQSMHNYGEAFDAVPMIGGKPLWSDTEGGGAVEDAHDEAIWQKYGELARYCGLQWAGDWTGFKEYPHCQSEDVTWKDLISKGTGTGFA